MYFILDKLETERDFKMKKIIVGVAIASSMLVALPAFAADTGNAMMHKTQLACVKTARSTRNVSIKTANQAFSAAMKSAKDARHDGMMAAKSDHSMLMMTKDHYKGAVQKARADRKAALKAAYAQYKTDAVSCKK
jgi:hypothetical protein